MFNKNQTMEYFFKLSPAKKAKTAISLIEGLTRGFDSLTESKTELLNNWLNYNPEMQIEDMIISIKISDMTEIMHEIGSWCLTNNHNNSYNLLLDAIGYLYLSSEGAIKTISSEDITIDNQLEKISNILKLSSSELLSSSVALLYICEQGHLSEDEPNMIGYKLLHPSAGDVVISV